MRYLSWIRHFTFVTVVTYASVFFTCDDEPSKPPSPIDSTSHAFSWQTDTLGGYLSRVNDVFCLSENEAYAVGKFNVFDSTGKNIYSLTCNLAKWDGLSWRLERIAPLFNGRPSFGELFTIFVLDKNNIWTSPARHWDGLSWTASDINHIATGMTTKIWCNNAREVWFSGENGSLMFWDGFQYWQKGYQTTASNLDVWGWNGTVYVATSDYDQQSGYRGYLIRVVNGEVQGRELETQGELIAVWGMDGVWYAGGCNGKKIFRSENGMWKEIHFPVSRCIASIRGTALNNIFFATESRGLFHFNGSSFQEILPMDDQASIFATISCANRSVFITSNRQGYALIYRGTRKE